jgi:uncharacterized protein YndB with AHSA1/START domain
MGASGELVVRLERSVVAPRQLVFSMFTARNRLARWWGPSGFSAPSVELDVRVGGRYRIEMQPPEGDAFWLSGEFREVEAPARLAYTFRWEEPDPDDRENLVVVTLRERGQATSVVIEHGPFATEARRSLHEQGWSDCLDRLEATVTARRFVQTTSAMGVANRELDDIASVLDSLEGDERR